MSHGAAHTSITPVPPLRELQMTNDVSYACQRKQQLLIVAVKEFNALSPQVEHSHVSSTIRQGEVTRTKHAIMCLDTLIMRLLTASTTADPRGTAARVTSMK
jgi:hypothetical protein